MKKDESEETGNVRQVNIVRLNESVNLISTYRSESMDSLIKKALDVLDKIKEDVR